MGPNAHVQGPRRRNEAKRSPAGKRSPGMCGWAPTLTLWADNQLEDAVGDEADHSEYAVHIEAEESER